MRYLKSVQVVDAMVHGDVGQPGVESSNGADSGEFLHRLHENVLRQVFRHRPVVHIPVTYRENPAKITTVFTSQKFTMSIQL